VLLSILLLLVLHLYVYLRTASRDQSLQLHVGMGTDTSSENKRYSLSVGKGVGGTNRASSGSGWLWSVAACERSTSDSADQHSMLILNSIAIYYTLQGQCNAIVSTRHLELLVLCWVALLGLYCNCNYARWMAV